MRLSGLFQKIKFIFIVSAITFSCGSKGNDYYTLKPVDIDYSILGSCSVRYPEPLEMTASSAGKVRSVLVKEGNFIKKDRLLIQFDDFTERKQMEISEKTLAAIRLKLENALNQELPKLREELLRYASDLDTAKIDMERKKTLYDSGNISKAEYELAANKYDQALSIYNQVKISIDTFETSGAAADLRKQIEIQVSQYELAVKAVEDKKITAPFDGTALKINVQPGESVQSGAAVMTVIEKSPWVLEAEVDQRELPFLRLDQNARVSFDAYNRDQVNANIIYVCSIVDAQKGTCNLRFEIKENKSYIKYGMSGTVEISAGTYKGRLALPSRFAERTGDGLYVWKWNEGSAERIKLDHELIGEQWVIVNNLDEGAKIFLPGPDAAGIKKLGKEIGDK